MTSLPSRPRLPLPELPDPGPAARALQAAALGGLRAVLAAQAVPPAEMLSDALCRWLVPVTVAGPLVRGVEKAMAKGALFGRARAQGPVHQAVAAEALAPRMPLRRAAQALRRRWLWLRRRPEAALAPPGLTAAGPALVATAFRDAVFRAETARVLHRALARRVLFHPGGPPEVRLADPTLLALALAGLPGDSGAAQASADLLTELAGQPGWAGFWDQWILGELARLDDHPLPSPIADLPVVRLRALALQGDPAADPPSVAKEWRNAIHGYCLSLLNGVP